MARPLKGCHSESALAGRNLHVADQEELPKLYGSEAIPAPLCSPSKITDQELPSPFPSLAWRTPFVPET